MATIAKQIIYPVFDLFSIGKDLCGFWIARTKSIV